MSLIKHRADRRIGLAVLVVGGWLCFVGCDTHSVDSADRRLPVFVGIPPLASLVEQIGGDRVHVDVLVQPGQDPHTFEATPQQMLALSKAKLFIQVGLPFERELVGKIKEGNKGLTVVDAAHGIQMRATDAACRDPHHESHSEAADHTNGDHDSDAQPDLVKEDGGGEPDPHVWLSPPLLKQVAKNIAEALEQADAANARVYADNLASLLDRIDAVNEKISKRLAPYRGRAFYVFHPGFGYFADAFGLKQVAVETGGRSPTPKQLQGLIAEARRDRVRVVFVQPQSPRQSAQVIAEAIGGKAVTINGLDSNVLRDMEDIAEKVAAAMKTE